MTPVLLYITAPNREEAISLVHELLGGRLIACANVVDQATSFYRWQGEIEHESESLIIAKSFAHHVKAIADKVKEIHSYECPCVVAVPIVDGNPDYIEWLQRETAAL